jgi:lipopolysaccharide transport system ATP-binding protein
MTYTTSVAIRVRGLGKCYQIYDQPQDRLRQSLLPRLFRALGKPTKDYFHEFWALRDVSFDIGRGETVGIVGRNGSGKSTLLQIICGTLAPTTGEVEVNGRVAALLELGAGFNPEFTGRENVYLNASVLGLSRMDIDERFEMIAEFADIGQFIEQPVKAYSSGMIVRLAFAVAINVDPEILIVDEALAVGDERFQRKCYSRIEDIKASGATVLFVSHSGATVIELCDYAVLLDDGEQLAMGPSKQIVGRYQRLLYATPEQREEVRGGILEEAAMLPNAVSDAPPDAPGDDSKTPDDSLAESFDPSLVPASTINFVSHGVEIGEAFVTTLTGERVNNLLRGRTYHYRYQVQFLAPASRVRFGMLIKTVAGVDLGGGISAANVAGAIGSVPAGAAYTIDFRFTCRLNVGVYFLNAGVVGTGDDGMEIFLHRLLDAAMFRVLPEPEDTATGPVDFDCVAQIALTDTAPARPGGHQ